MVRVDVEGDQIGKEDLLAPGEPVDDQLRPRIVTAERDVEFVLVVGNVEPGVIRRRRAALRLQLEKPAHWFRRQPDRVVQPAVDAGWSRADAVSPHHVCTRAFLVGVQQGRKEQQRNGNREKQ